ncbi:MAG: hypothetical protein EOO61_15555, partial [Hymenobacter sp.]
MAITQEQVKVYEFIFNMAMRLLLTCAGIYAFFLVLHALLDAKTPGDKGTYAFMETLIAGTTFWPYRFYFSFANKESTAAGSTAPAAP